ncbi:hypothetical protein ACI65C_005647 [Semiaphis heraclei]
MLLFVVVGVDGQECTARLLRPNVADRKQALLSISPPPVFHEPTATPRDAYVVVDGGRAATPPATESAAGGRSGSRNRRRHRRARNRARPSSRARPPIIRPPHTPLARRRRKPPGRAAVAAPSSGGGGEQSSVGHGVPISLYDCCSVAGGRQGYKYLQKADGNKHYKKEKKDKMIVNFSALVERRRSYFFEGLGSLRKVAVAKPPPTLVVSASIRQCI